jgi:hypothetical protein
MITAVVRFRLPQGTTRDDAKALAGDLCESAWLAFHRGRASKPATTAAAAKAAANNGRS